MSTTSILWLRRDLRRTDLPALNVAADAADEVLPLFVADPALLATAGPVRGRAIAGALSAARASYDDALVIRHGDPRDVVPAVAARLGATSVHISGEVHPYGRQRDADVEARLGDIPLVRTGTPYAVAPGTILTRVGTGYRVFTPFSRAWRDHGADAPAPDVAPRWSRAIDNQGLPEVADSDVDLPECSEAAAWRTWVDFREHHLADYDTDRDRPDLDATSRLSMHLKFGTIHARSLLADLAGESGAGVERFITELCWREFYADVLHHHPGSAWADLTDALAGMAYDDPETEAAERFAAWCEGRTGFPMVDAGMRQLRGEGWMHNRVRMIAASFLTKDLHIWWPHGARHFLQWLCDGDVASNSHGWQWTAGTGTDASPYFRVFNPVSQGIRFDPDGAYVRRWIPELAHLPGASAHTPWDAADGYAHGYPERIVDHAEERLEALRRYDEVR